MSMSMGAGAGAAGASAAASGAPGRTSTSTSTSNGRPTIQSAALVQSPQPFEGMEEGFRRDVSARHLKSLKQRRLGLLQFRSVPLLLEEGCHFRSYHFGPGR